MKKTVVLLSLIIIGLIIQNSLNAQSMKVKITIGNKEFTVTLHDSDAAKEFVKMLPLDVTMGEHNGNEKFYNLPKSISGKSTNPRNVEAGDLMIWSSSTLVLFYANSSTYYSYIRIGKIDNTSGLREAVGKGSVKVKYELIEEEEND